VEPVDQQSYARYLVQQHQVVPTPQERGIDGLTLVLDQLTGFSAPAQVWETALLPARISDYQPAMLDKLLATGQFRMVGAPDQSAASSHADTLALTLPLPHTEHRVATHQHRRSALTGTRAWFFAALAAQLNYRSEALPDALWALFWAGQVTNDTFSAVRATYTKSTTRAQPQRTPMRHRARLRRLNRLAPSQPPSPTTVGRLAVVTHRTDDNTAALHAQAEHL